MTQRAVPLISGVGAKGGGVREASMRSGPAWPFTVMASPSIVATGATAETSSSTELNAI